MISIRMQVYTLTNEHEYLALMIYIKKKTISMGIALKYDLVGHVNEYEFL